MRNKYPTKKRASLVLAITVQQKPDDTPTSRQTAARDNTTNLLGSNKDTLQQMRRWVVVRVIRLTLYHGLLTVTMDFNAPRIRSLDTERDRNVRQ
jgi:hypothetical protein